MQHKKKTRWIRMLLSIQLILYHWNKTGMAKAVMETRQYSLIAISSLWVCFLKIKQILCCIFEDENKNWLGWCYPSSSVKNLTLRKTGEYSPVNDIVLRYIRLGHDFDMIGRRWSYVAFSYLWRRRFNFTENMGSCIFIYSINNTREESKRNVTFWFST